MTQVPESTQRGPATAKSPAATWILMASALGTTLLLPDWSGSGPLLPIWFMALPLMLGLAGAWAASRAGQLGWALASAVWSAALVPGLWILVVLVSGP